MVDAPIGGGDGFTSEATPPNWSLRLAVHHNYSSVANLCVNAHRAEGVSQRSRLLAQKIWLWLSWLEMKPAEEPRPSLFCRYVPCTGSLGAAFQ